MKQTQCERILTHLTAFGHITSWEAMRDYGIMRLASRVHDLKKQGYRFEKTNVTGKNRFGETCHWTQYELKEKP